MWATLAIYKIPNHNGFVSLIIMISHLHAKLPLSASLDASSWAKKVSSFKVGHSNQIPSNLQKSSSWTNNKLEIAKLASVLLR